MNVIEKTRAQAAGIWARSKTAAVVAVASASALTLPAQAAAIDVGDLVTDIGAQAVPVGLVGVAVLMIYGAVKAFKWVRAAMS